MIEIEPGNQYSEIDLRDYSFKNKNLVKTRFIDCDFTNCDLSTCSFRATQFWSCDLENVNFGNNLITKVSATEIEVN